MPLTALLKQGESSAGLIYDLALLRSRTVFARLEKTEDPWKDFWRKAVPLKKTYSRLEERYAA